MVEARVKLGFIALLLFVLLGVGTIAFTYLEAWGPIDSLYFSAMTLTTIGYGDLYPTSTVSKLFTIVYAILGVALVLYALSVMARWYIERGQRFEEHEIKKLRGLLWRDSFSEGARKR